MSKLDKIDQLKRGRCGDLLRAHRRIGELSAELEKGVNKFTLPTSGKSKNSSLKLAGISTSSASRAEQNGINFPTNGNLISKGSVRSPSDKTIAAEVIENGGIPQNSDYDEDVKSRPLGRCGKAQGRPRPDRLAYPYLGQFPAVLSRLSPHPPPEVIRGLLLRRYIGKFADLALSVLQRCNLRSL